jgi:hypothetical protein
MLDINCLLNNSQLKHELLELVEFYAEDIIADDKSPVVNSVFRNLKRDGFEIDAQTVGHLYREVFSDRIDVDNKYSTENEIADFINEPYIKLLSAQAENNKANGIGRNAPAQAVASALANALKLTESVNPTVQRIMQDRLLKAAKRVTGFKGEKADTRLTSEDIIREVLTIHERNVFGKDAGVTNIDGRPFAAMENAETLWREFKKEIKEVADMLDGKGDVYNADKLRAYANILEDASYQLMMSMPEIQKVINDTLKAAGYKKKAGDKEIVDWNKAINDTKLDFRETFKSVFRESGDYTEKQLSWIADEMDREYTKVRSAKTAAALAQKNKGVASRKQKGMLQKFNDLYNMGIFSASNQKALFKLLGIDSATTEQVNNLEKLGKVLSEHSADGIDKWNETGIKTLSREIENIIERAEENKIKGLTFARAYGHYVQLSNALIVSNYFNVTENALTGLNHLFMTYMTTQPKRAVEMLKIFGHVASDYAKGGVKYGEEPVNTFNKIGSAEERFNAEQAKTVKEKIAATVALIPRLVLGVADNAIKASMSYLVGVDILRAEIEKQGFSKSESNLIVTEILHGNRAKIEAVAKSFEEELRASGVKVAKGKWKRMADDMAWANMETNGEFFKELWAKLQERGMLAGKELNLDETLIKQIKGAAESAASKSLGHMADNYVMWVVDKIAGSVISGNLAESRQKRGQGMVSNTLMQGSYGQLTAFRYGGMRWMFLTYEKSGIGLLQTLITDVAFKRTRAFNAKEYDNIDKLIADAKEQKEKDELIAIRGKQMAWYAARRQRLARNIIGTIEGYMGILFLTMLASGGGDDDEKRESMLEYAKDIMKDPRRRRWAQKSLPPRFYNYLTSIAWVNKYGTVESIKAKDVVLPFKDDLFETFLGIGKGVLKEEGFRSLEPFQIFKNNWNQSKTSRLFESSSWGEAGEAIAGAVFTPPLKVIDMHSSTFLPADTEKANKPKTLLEGMYKGILTKRMWKSYAGKRDEGGERIW